MVDKDKFEKEEELGYNIYIVGKNFELTEPMRQHVLDKLSKIERFHNHIMDVHVTLEIQKVEHICVMTCHFNHVKVKVEARSSDMYASIDKSISKLQRQFSKWKGKLQNYHRKPVNMVDMVVNVYRRPPVDEVEEINAEIDADTIESWMPGKVLATEARPLKILTMDEAIMKMELSSDNFLLYRDESDNRLKVIYRRKDQNYGVIQPEM